MGRSRPNLETWETTTDSVHSVNTYNARGDNSHKVVGGRAGMKIQLTSEEREDLNEEMAADARSCIFRNGFLRPVRDVPDEVMERFVKETKPHGGMEAEELIGALDTMDGDAFRAYVGNLNRATLIRFKNLAEAADARASQMAILDEALAEGRPVLRETATDRMLRRDPADQGAPDPSMAGPVQ